MDSYEARMQKRDKDLKGIVQHFQLLFLPLKGIKHSVVSLHSMHAFACVCPVSDCKITCHASEHKVR